VSAAGAPLSTLFLLDEAPLFGGTKVILRQADLLHRAGHRVAVAVRGAAPDWYRPQAPLHSVAALDPRHLPAADLVVATYWTTIEPALAAAAERALHYCQGFEFDYTHNAGDHARIERLYALPVPALVVSDHLAAELWRRFARPARVVPQPLEPWFRPRPRLRPPASPRVLVCGPFEIDWKGVATALEAIRLLRARGWRGQLVRLSQWPLTAEESRILPADEFHCHLEPQAVSDLMRGCDLLLAPSWEQEGFGLPALEAMASGIPVVSSDVGCYRSWAAEAAILVPPRDPTALADAAAALLASPSRWRRQRRRGLQLARRYGEQAATRALEEALRWAMTTPSPELAR